MIWRYLKKIFTEEEDMAGKRILIVDDDKSTLDLLGRNLPKAGYQVMTAKDGQGARDQIKKYLPDLIVMDIMLPDIDGQEVVKSLQADSLTRNIPVVFLSGIIEKKECDIRPEIKVGDRCYPAIGKPPSWEELLSKVESALE